MSGWEDSIPAPDPSPSERAIEREEHARQPLLHVLSEGDRDLLRKVRSEMRRMKPHFYVVFNALLEHGDVFASVGPDGGVELEHDVFRGFYTDLSVKLGITPNAVKYRAAVSLKWFVKRARFHIADRERLR